MKLTYFWRVSAIWNHCAAEAIEATTETSTASQNENKDDPRRRQVVDLGEFLFHKFKKTVQLTL
jgi:hypothetical protein